MLKPFVLLCITLLPLNQLQSQVLNRKKISTTRVKRAPKIDGVLDDDAWKNVEIAKDFIMLRPDNGEAEPNTHKTEVKFIYDNNAIYIAATLYDNDPTSIPMEFANRDNFGFADFFSVTINPNDDGQNPFEFAVMSTGTQVDSKVSSGRKDYNWSAVWRSAVKLTDKGWTLEMKIPYSALRFANTPVQSWGVNFHRNIKNLNAQFTWNPIDNTKRTWTQYDGLVENLKDINPPTRLSFYPYASTSVSHFDGETSNSHNLGLDLKYGVTENFTLDVTLVPDFGQTAFDNVTLNLGPFEQQFSEQRQFFTEGTELFDKGGLFYSRRIGSTPTRFYDVYDNLAANEEVTSNPENVNMLNAVKISGRTKNGLGIGFFNAITDETKATIKKSVIENGVTVDEYYKKTTEPFANYNVFVLDKQFNQNSSVTFINTNVLREGAFRDANVTGLLYHLTNNKNTYFADGHIKSSSINEFNTTKTGYSFDSSIAKIAGNWRGEFGYNFRDDNFDINDFGFQRRNNNQVFYGNISYRILKPTKRYNSFNINLNFNSDYLYTPGKYTGTSARISMFATTKKRFTYGIFASGRIGNTYNYFEARREISEGRLFVKTPRISVSSFISTDFRKKFALDVRGSIFYAFGNDDAKGYGFNFSPRYRFNNRFSLIYRFNYRYRENVLGYVTDIDIDPNTATDNRNNPIIFGKRNSEVYENNISGKYSFSIKSSISLSFRHFWTPVTYSSQFLILNPDGFLSNHSYTNNHNINYNSWNLDLNYLWEFAPGSQLIAFYRNSIFNANEQSQLNFSDNLEDLFNQPALHTFSLKFVYYIDYNRIKNIF